MEGIFKQQRCEYSDKQGGNIQMIKVGIFRQPRCEYSDTKGDIQTIKVAIFRQAKVRLFTQQK